MKWLLVLFSVAGLVLPSGCSPDAPTPVGGGSEGRNKDDRPREVRLCPVIRLKAAGPLRVPLSITNGSDKPFTYVTSYGKSPGLDYTLRRNGKVVPRDTPTPGPIPNPIYTAKTLEPKESLLFNHELDRYSKLEPGEYDLQLVYRVYEGSTVNLKYNATPAHFTLSYTLIVE